MKETKYPEKPLQLGKRNILQSLNKPLFRALSRVAKEMGIEAYLVGGFVRDLMLGREGKDIDVVIAGPGIEFAKKIHKALNSKTRLVIYKNFGTAYIKTGSYDLEIVGARKESYRRSSRKPHVKEGTLKDDLLRRDFTINALAVSLNEEDFGQLTDRFGGMDDLKKNVIRTPADPAVTFSDDPLRMIRAVRFTSQLNFNLHPHLLEAMKKNRDRIKIVSRERISEELNKILLSSLPSRAFKLLQKSGLLSVILPELDELKGVETIDNRSHKDNFYHTLQVVDNVVESSDNLWLRWAALLHDVGKAPTKKYSPEQGWTFHGHDYVGSRMIPVIFRKIRLPLDQKMRYVQKLVRLHLRPISLTRENVTDSGIRRLIVDAGDEIEDLMVLCRADITSKNQEKVKRYLIRFNKVWKKIKEVEEKDRLRNWKPPVSGKDIMETFNIAPSPLVGEIKEAIKEAILNGEINNDRNEAWEYMIKAGKEKGLKPTY